jgi:hypothetical protein
MTAQYFSYDPGRLMRGGTANSHSHSALSKSMAALSRRVRSDRSR